MVDFVPSRAMIDVAQRKRETNAVTLLKRIRKFSMTQDIGARATANVFNRISFAIAKKVGAQIAILYYEHMPSPYIAQRSFDVALRSSLERIVTASGPGFGDWQWRLVTLPFAFGGLGVYSVGNVLNYAFPESQLPSAGLQTKLL
ncbi:hypothetical protein Tco_0673565, partial [Tanacetum coccineum]